MDFIFARHGTVTSDHITEAKRTLRLPFDNVRHSLDSHRVAMQHQFGFLQRAHNPVNQGDMMDFYETSVAAHPHILSAIRLYKNATLLADRSFVTMAAYTEIHAPDQIANSIDLGYANYSCAHCTSSASTNQRCFTPTSSTWARLPGESALLLRSWLCVT